MFPGQGSQYVNMGRDIYEREPVFKKEVDRCAELLQPELNVDLICSGEASVEDSGLFQQYRVLKNIQLDWCVLCASMGSIIGGVQIDYGAANAFLDAFAYQTNNSTRRVIAINWDGWQQVGMAAAKIQQENEFLNQEGSNRHRLINIFDSIEIGYMPSHMG